jgi:hypothetical protein
MRHPERGKEKLGSFEGTLPRFLFFYARYPAPITISPDNRSGI